METDPEPTSDDRARAWWRRWDGLPPSFETFGQRQSGFTNTWWYYFLVTAWAWNALVQGLIEDDERDLFPFWVAVAVLVVVTPLFVRDRRRSG